MLKTMISVEHNSDGNEDYNKDDFLAVKSQLTSDLEKCYKAQIQPAIGDLVSVSTPEVEYMLYEITHRSIYVSLSGVVMVAYWVKDA